MFEFKNHTSNIPTLNFFIKFLLYIIIFQWAVYLIQTNSFISLKIQTTLVNTVAYIYQLFAEPVIINGNTLRHVNSSKFLIVDNECTGLILLASVCSVLMAFNYSWWAKLKMILVAVFILEGENIIRMTHLLHEIKKENNDFDIYHLYIWQIINFVTALFVISAVKRWFRDKEL